jgi:threonine/homoserine/homoserine lactone efflux protein
MALDLAALGTFCLAFTLALISPGPNFALMLRVGLTSGRRVALRTVLGIAVGEAVWGLAAVFGVAALALRFPPLGTAIRWAGGVFLLWLAFGALRSAWRGGQEAREAGGGGGGGGGGFTTGLLLMLLNAKAGFFWVSLTGVLLGAEVGAPTAAVAVLTAVLLSLLWHATLALAFSGTRVTRLYARARRGIEAVLGAALGALGVRLLAAG